MCLLLYQFYFHFLNSCALLLQSVSFANIFINQIEVYFCIKIYTFFKKKSLFKIFQLVITLKKNENMKIKKI
jgi:hypothetical protein